MSTNVELRDEYIRLAKQSEAAAGRRHAQLRENAKRQLSQRYPAKFTRLTPTEQQAQIRDLAFELQKNDPIWKGHVADNQWYIQQAIMFGTAANGDLLQQLVNALPETSARRTFG